MRTFRALDLTVHGTLDFPCEYYFVNASHPRYQMPSHWHNEWEIIRIIEGSFQIYTDLEAYSLKKGDIFLLRPGTLHRGIPIDCVYECLVFDLYGLFTSIDIAKKHLRDFYRGNKIPFCHYKHGQIPKIESCVGRLMSSFDEKNEFRELDILMGTAELFKQILKERAWQENTSDSFSSHQRIEQIKKVLEYIEENYASPISLETLAKQLNMNPKYFCRIFSSLTHQSPMDYVNFYRIEKAAFLIDTTNLSITTVGLECGFGESSYFTKVFKKYKGVTPKQYRNRS